MKLLEERLSSLSPAILASLRRGVEKESLRTDADGDLSLAPHPSTLGSPLTHPHITTDFSESQPELITGVHETAETCIEELREIHGFVYRNIGNEYLWACSMPCGLPADADIPLGQYGKSNIASAKTVYRQGLVHRYGSRMQTISGIHYNFSLPDEAWPALMQVAGHPISERAFRDAAYFGQIRNFRRYSWLLLYLFGASPALCETFLHGRSHRLRKLGSGSLFLPHATSLRMGPLGYQSNAQARLAVSFNCLDSYAESLSRGMSEVYPAYQKIGIRDAQGNYLQLSTTLLQIENEFYGTIRPKQPTRSGERPLHALRERGVQYVEVRLLDLDPFEPVGISARTMHFLDVFLLYCLLADSPADTSAEIAEIAHNQYKVAQSGRDPGLRLRRGGRETDLRSWGVVLLDACEPVARALDNAYGACAGGVHAAAVESARLRVTDVSSTPSARVLDAIRSRYDDSFRAFALMRSREHRDTLLGTPLTEVALQRQRRAVERSFVEQGRIEAADAMPFETYRLRYLAGSLMADDASAA